MARKHKILCTGSCGFIFSNFIRYALHKKLPYTFVSIDKLVALSNRQNIYLNPDHKFYPGDIADGHFIDNVFGIEKPDIVINGAAESFVDDSIANANPFINSNVLGTQVITNACLKHGVDKLVYVSCYDNQTRAVTKYGFKSWDELKKGDKVLSINPDTGVVEEKKINKVICQDYVGKMLHFNSRRTDFCITPNHRCILTNQVNDVKNKSKLYWHLAENIPVIKNNYLPTGRVHNGLVEKIHIDGIGSVDSLSLFYVCGVFIADGFTAYQKKKIKNITGLNRGEFLKQCIDQKTGQFVKTGFIGDKEFTECNSYRIFFDVPEKDKARAKLEKCLKKLNINFNCHKNKSGEHIYFSSKEWLAFFNQFGYLAANKHIPGWMFNYGYSLLKSLWEGVHDGDGHGNNIKGRNVSITTVSNKLSAQLCYLGACIGYTPRVSNKYSISHIDGRKIEGKTNVVHFSQQRRPKVPKPIEKEYSGKIWCLTVEDNKNFLVERNGLITYSGNTDEVYGQLSADDDSKWTEDFPIAPRNPYSASKAAGELIVKAAHETHGLEYNITRSCNNFGPRQSKKNFIPKIIKCILEKKPIPIFGDGSNEREWIYVIDNCRAILSILEKGGANETYNIGTGHNISNLELVNLICNIMETGHNLISFIDDPRPGHDFKYSVDSNKIRQLGWTHNTKLRDGLVQTIKWYVNNKWYLR